MKENLNNCPVCEDELLITKYKCNNCDTEIKGKFKNNKFINLTKEQLDFLEIFVLKRGSIKEIEKELNISYPTVRNKLDNVISTLTKIEPNKPSKMEILNMLNNGDITSKEATEMLNNSK